MTLQVPVDMTSPQGPPSVKWTPDSETILVTLPVSKSLFVDHPDEDIVLQATWETDFTYVARIREAGSDEWGVGFEMPLLLFWFTDLKPHTEYEVELRARRGEIDSHSVTAKGRTDAFGRVKIAGNDVVD